MGMVRMPVVRCALIGISWTQKNEETTMGIETPWKTWFLWCEIDWGVFNGHFTLKETWDMFDQQT